MIGHFCNWDDGMMIFKGDEERESQGCSMAAFEESIVMLVVVVEDGEGRGMKCLDVGQTEKVGVRARAGGVASFS